VEFLTDVQIHLNGTEERRKKRPPLTRFILPYTRINLADMTAMRNFHASQRGTFDTTWSFTLGSTTYSHLTFEDLTFNAQEDDLTRTTYSFTLHARQTQNSGQTAGSAGGTFAHLASGAVAEFPYTQINRSAVLVSDNVDCGMRYSYAWYGGGLSGFPTARCAAGLFAIR
jgi:hypothetical protein